MSNEVIFLLFVMLPLLVFGLLMTIAQRKFLRSYREIVNPDKPISFEEVIKLIIKKPDNILKYRHDINNYPNVVLKLYWSHFKNPKLEREASQVRKLIILAIVVPLLGFIFAFFIGISR